MLKLFLDDQREPWDDSWELVKTPLEFKRYIIELHKETGRVPEVISFDHDLADEHYHQYMFSDPVAYNELYKTFKYQTGLDCAKWFFQFCVDEGLSLPQVFVHSMNPVGAMNICNAYCNFSLFYFGEDPEANPTPYNEGSPV